MNVSTSMSSFLAREMGSSIRAGESVLDRARVVSQLPHQAVLVRVIKDDEFTREGHPVSFAPQDPRAQGMECAKGQVAVCVRRLPRPSS